MHRLKILASATIRTSAVYHQVKNKLKSFIYPATVRENRSISSTFDELIVAGGLSPSTRQLQIVKMMDDLDLQLNEQESYLINILGRKKPFIQGIYLYGNPGCGKTMLLDLFFHKTKTSQTRKQRHHFHQFMLQIHQQLFQISKLPKHLRAEYPLIEVANSIIANGTVIYLDEFQVTGNIFKK